MEEYLSKYENLCQVLSSIDDCVLPIMDLGGFINDDPEDYYGCNLTGKFRMYMLFFTGQSNYFPGILVGEQNEDNLDQYPIYIIDIASDNEFELIGNFKTYMSTIFDWALEQPLEDENTYEYIDDDDILNYITQEMRSDILEAKKELEQFSDTLFQFDYPFNRKAVLLE